MTENGSDPYLFEEPFKSMEWREIVNMEMKKIKEMQFIDYVGLTSKFLCLYYI